MTPRIAILISGGGSNMRALVEDMERGGYAIPAIVLSNTPEAGGLKWAQERNIPTAIVDHRNFGKNRAAFEAALSGALEHAQAELICLAGFMRILTPEFVQSWEGRILNIHPSLLPDYKGLNTHARALSDGRSEHGCTVHLVTPALDDGPILGQRKVAVIENDTAQTLGARVLKQEHILYPQTLRAFLEDYSTRYGHLGSADLG